MDGRVSGQGKRQIKLKQKLSVNREMESLRVKGLSNSVPSVPTSTKRSADPPPNYWYMYKAEKKRKTVQDILLSRLSSFKNTPVHTPKSTPTSTLKPIPSHLPIKLKAYKQIKNKFRSPAYIGKKGENKTLFTSWRRVSRIPGRRRKSFFTNPKTETFKTFVEFSASKRKWHNNSREFPVRELTAGSWRSGSNTQQICGLIEEVNKALK